MTKGKTKCTMTTGDQIMGFIEDKIQNNRSFVEIASIFRQDFVNFPDIEFSMRKIIVRGGKNRSP